jgi:hypothetical protein
MKLHRIVASAATMLILSPAAFATVSSPASCAALQSQFDKQLLTTTVKNVDQAKALSVEGSKLCSAGKRIDGERKLQEAIRMLGHNAPK